MCTYLWWAPHSLLARVHTSAATMEISMEISQKTKNRAAVWPSCISPEYMTFLNAGIFKLIFNSTLSYFILSLSLFISALWDRVSCSPGWPLTCRVAEGTLELLVLLPPALGCWASRGVLLYLLPTPEPVHARHALHPLSHSPRPSHIWLYDLFFFSPKQAIASGYGVPSNCLILDS